MKLVIAEKPSVAKAIAPVIGTTAKKNGYIEGNGYYVSWCYGHLVRLFMPDEYCEAWATRQWTFDMLPMLPDEWKFKVTNDCKDQFDVLRKLMQDSTVTEVICATDADREGECIFRYVYYLAGCKKPFKRLWVSSLEESAIKDGFAKMQTGSAYDSLYQAGFCRNKADWLIGMNGSRLFSIRYRSRLNLGRVQTPTLAMIVQRDYDVAHFVKQKYLTVLLHCGTFTAESERIDEESKAAALAQACNGKTAVLSELKKEIKTDKPPKLYDLTTLQRDANKHFGYTAKQTLDALQSLYEAKLATYPRTDSQYLTDDMEQTAVDMVGRVLAKYPQFGKQQTINVQRCINNKKVTGHHAILPTERITDADLSQLPEAQQKVLCLISARLILATAEPHRYEAVHATVRCADTDFTATGKSIKEIGWKALEANVNVMLRSKASDDEQDATETKALPDLVQGQTFANTSGAVAEHWTSPPRPYTEAALLSAMERAGNEEYDEETEKKGLGTPATRAAIIEGLVKAEYIQRKGKQITATEKGVNLIAVVPDEVKSPKLTADWEMQLQLIEHGKADAAGFMDRITSYVKDLCAKYATEDSTVSFHRQSDGVGKCPHCGSAVKKGQYGYYCTQKCGMFLAKVYGKVLTDNQLMRLLSGKETSFSVDGKKTIVLPEAVEHTYNGKTGWQWKTRKG